MPKEKTKRKLTFYVDSIGPFYGKTSINQSLDISGAIHNLVYSPNGSGKTTISRALSVISGKSLFDSSNLISFGKDIGNLLISIDTETIASLSIHRDEKPIVSCKEGLLIHVFNSDYIEYNVRQAEYQFNQDNTIGFILGKHQIDLSDEKERLKQLDQDKNKCRESVEIQIDATKKKLKNSEVQPNTKDYIAIKWENIIDDGYLVDEPESYDVLLKEYKELKIMDNIEKPIDLKTIEPINYDELQSILSTSYVGKFFEDEFKKDYKENKDFYEHGLDIYQLDKSRCPFCKQNIGNNAEELIHKYEEFRNDTEGKVTGKLKAYKEQLNRLEDKSRELKTHYQQQTQIFNSCANLIDRMKEKTIVPNLDISPLERSITSLLAHIDQKINDIRIEITVDLEDIKDAISNLNHIIDSTNQSFSDLRRCFDNNDILLDKRRRLCNSAFNNIRSSLHEVLLQYKALTQQYEDLDEKIRQKENSIKIERREKVEEVLSKLLKKFFNDKYTFNKELFSIVFRNHGNIPIDSQHISDGEKSIIAFCFYIAETYNIVQTLEELDHVFFVIDDPISSLDYDHIYSVMEIIRDLHTLFGIRSNRYLVLTHNINLFNLMVKTMNREDNCLVLSEGKLYFDKGPLIPYEMHLLDIIKVANGAAPTHTTANSVRHVLENICSFESPGTPLIDFIKSKSVFDNSSFYQLIEDLSHGRMRDSALPIDAIIASC